MKNYMKKMVMMAVCAMSMSMTAFAAEPAFDSPQEEYVYNLQEKANRLWEEDHNLANQVGCDDPVLYAVPAFDSPQEEYTYNLREKERQKWEEDYNLANQVGCDDPVLYAGPAFDSPQEEYDFYHK